MQYNDTNRTVIGIFHEKQDIVPREAGCSQGAVLMESWVEGKYVEEKEYKQQ